MGENASAWCGRQIHSHQLVDCHSALGRKHTVLVEMLRPAMAVGEEQSHHGDRLLVKVGGPDENDQNGVTRIL